MPYNIDDAWIKAKWEEEHLREAFARVFCRRTKRNPNTYVFPADPPAEFRGWLAGDWPPSRSARVVLR